MSGFGPGLGWGSKQRGIKLTATFLGAVLIPGRDTPVWVGHFPGRGGRKEQLGAARSSSSVLCFLGTMIP
jgi:hypothetical protein